VRQRIDGRRRKGERDGASAADAIDPHIGGRVVRNDAPLRVDILVAGVGDDDARAVVGRQGGAVIDGRVGAEDPGGIVGLARADDRGGASVPEAAAKSTVALPERLMPVALRSRVVLVPPLLSMLTTLDPPVIVRPAIVWLWAVPATPLS